MLAFAFNELGLCRVSGRCMAKNGASRKVMEKLGFLYEGTGRRELLKDGVFLRCGPLSYFKRKNGPAISVLSVFSPFKPGLSNRLCPAAKSRVLFKKVINGFLT